MEVMTIDSLNGLRGLKGINSPIPDFDPRLSPSQDLSSLTVAQANDLFNFADEARGLWIAAFAADDMPEAALREVQQALNIFTVEGNNFLNSTASSAFSARLNANQVALLRRFLASAQALHAAYVSTSARYGKNLVAGDIFGALTLVAGACGIYVLLKRRKRRR
jgi:hypothetical protein